MSETENQFPIPSKPANITSILEPLAARLPLRILVVDDTPFNLKVHLSLLRYFGYHAEIATNGREALEMLDRQPFNFIFMDMMMPEMDGLEATRQIRMRQLAGEHKNYQSGIIIVAATSEILANDREICLAAGMDDYLTLPLRPKEVREMIELWGDKLK